jgi:hypothetical protein
MLIQSSDSNPKLPMLSNQSTRSNLEKIRLNRIQGYDPNPKLSFDPKLPIQIQNFQSMQSSDEIRCKNQVDSMQSSDPNPRFRFDPKLPIQIQKIRMFQSKIFLNFTRKSPENIIEKTFFYDFFAGKIRMKFKKNCPHSSLLHTTIEKENPNKNI